MRRAASVILVSLLLSVGATACSNRGDDVDAEVDLGGGVDLGLVLPDAGTTFPDSGIGLTTLGITRVVPDHGSFRGGQTAVIRGSGLDARTADVFFGPHMVQPADITQIDSYRMRVVVPAGDVGPVPVSITQGGDMVTLPNGYTYDAIYVEPDRGSVAGGTFVTITGQGTHWADGDTVTFGHAACVNVMVISETRITCRTPPLTAGTVDVTVTHVADGTSAVGVGAYTFFDTSDPIGGGLGGGPVDGSINVTVINAQTGGPVEMACVILGDGSGPNGGQTDASGQITISDSSLEGPQTVTVAKHCFEKTTFVDADASDVTVFLVPDPPETAPPDCGMPGEPPTGRSRSGSFVSGELIWLGAHEFAPNPWTNIPPPRGDEVKVAYVFATQNDLNYPNPDPSQPMAGTIQRVLEVLPSPLPPDARGYPYDIFVAPGAMAVYALSGLESTSTGIFTPYIMGIARNVLVGPGETATHVNMTMNIPLDHTAQVIMSGLPMRARTGPTRFKVTGLIDLGGEGYIVRNVNGHDYDTVRRPANDRPFTLVQQPALFDALSDGRYQFDAGWYTGDYDGFPFTQVTLRGVSDVNVPVTLDGYLGVPQATSPAYGDPIPADRILRWTADGADPSFHEILMSGGDGNPAWRIFTPGNVRQAPIPDMRSCPVCMSDDIAGGSVFWEIYAVTVPGLVYDEFSYQYLSSNYWTKSAADYYTSSL